VKPILIYCYDAYCGWCYGFSPVINKITVEYAGIFEVEILSGGMLLPEKPIHISAMASFISDSYTTVEETTGIKFGEDYLWHIKNHDQSDWFPNSLKPSIALCIFKDFCPEKMFEVAADFQYSLFYEGRDLTDDEAYRHLLEKYSINTESFYEKLSSEEYRDMAHYEFSLVQQLKVEGYPTVFIQINDSKFHMIARGYTNEADLRERINAVLASMQN